MSSSAGSTNLDVQSDGTAYVRLDPVTVRVLVDEARTNKKVPAQLIRQAIDDWREREFDRKALARLRKRGPTNPADAVPWQQVKKDLGL